MKLTITDPVTIRIPTELVGKVQEALSYEDKKVTYEWLKWNRVLTQPGHWWYRRNSKEELELKVNQLKKDRIKSLLFKDEQGYWSYSGLVTKLSNLLNIPVERTFKLPEFGIVGWENNPFEPRWYQTKAVDLLAPEDYSRNHGAVQLATGCGKSLIIALLLKRIGLSAVIMCPTVSIKNQLTKSLTEWFGKDKVCSFGDGKRKTDKMFVVAIAASLARVKENTKEYQALSSKQVFICDESHLTPADTLSRVSLGLFSKVPYRYFLSGTQIRGDGLDLLLEGIIGDVVLEMSVQEGIKQGFLSPLRFIQWNVTSDSDFDSSDAIKMNRVHLHNNPKVNKHAVKLARYAVSKGRRVLILISEVDQFIKLKEQGLLEGLRVAFAHGEGLDSDQKKEIPVNFHKSDPGKLVDSFDAGEYDVLVGTSCIQTGTDIKSVSCIISLVGLTSEIQIRQGVIGRGTRLHSTKTDCLIMDYAISNIKKLETHAKKRRRIFNTIQKCEVKDIK